MMGKALLINCCAQVGGGGGGGGEANLTALIRMNPEASQGS